MTEKSYKAIYTCQECGEKFEDDFDVRRKYCDKCQVKRLDAGRVRGGKQSKRLDRQG